VSFSTRIGVTSVHVADGALAPVGVPLGSEEPLGDGAAVVAAVVASVGLPDAPGVAGLAVSADGEVVPLLSGEAVPPGVVDPVPPVTEGVGPDKAPPTWLQPASATVLTAAMRPALKAE